LLPSCSSTFLTRIPGTRDATNWLKHRIFIISNGSGPA
jgi:hypothetical protein